MIRLADKWWDYAVLATGDGYKLERWGEVTLLRPDPQVIWGAQGDLFGDPRVDAVYRRSEKGGGVWEYRRKIPESWTVSYGELRFCVKPMGFKHTGLFPEQAVNWERTAALVTRAKAAGRNVKILGLTGGIRYIVDDCMKFVQREIRRGNRYDGIVMDPPSYGRGPGGEMWKIETGLYPFVKLCSELLSEDPLFFLINSYTTGLQPAVLSNLLSLCLAGRKGGIDAYEVGLPTEEGIVLPCGAGGIYTHENDE